MTTSRAACGPSRTCSTARSSYSQPKRRAPSRHSAPHIPASTSSKTMPAPPGRRRSARRAGQGFQTSKIRNKTKPAISPVVVRGAAIQVTKTPATSSMQMIWGSFPPNIRAKRPEAQTPMAVIATAATATATGPCERISKYRGIAPKVPACPGAFGKYPHPNQTART